MNIKLTYNWLLEFLETSASPFDIQKYLSLSGSSIERVEKAEDDFIFDIEIISNRIDTASVIGIAQEAQAILPMYGIPAKIKFNPLTSLKFSDLKEKLKYNLKLEVSLDKNMCSRFTALIFEDVKLGPSASFIQKRLTASGVKVINNIVDISNYLMLTLGQPVHMFDYDKIDGGKMILRSSKKGEKIKLLDGQDVNLPQGSIVIEDGAGKLTDLCGIMGGAKSAINKDTKRVIFFVQTYNKERIRKTVMETGVRTLAATYFEKGLDEERVEPTVVYGASLIEKYTGGRIASELIDLYYAPYKKKILDIRYSIFDKIIGVKIERRTIDKILEDLGFEVERVSEERLKVAVPSYRKYDIDIPEDLVEEVARVWGYHKIPALLSPPANVIQPVEFEKIFKVTSKVKYFLKHQGFHEVINYSMISSQMIKQWGGKEEEHLKLANTISKEIEYMRLSLLPSLFKNILDNTGKKEELRFFELAKVYLRDRPCKESYRLGFCSNTDYFDLKGAVEGLIDELNVDSVDWRKGINNKFYSLFFNQNFSATGFLAGKEAIYLGQSRLDNKVFLAEIDFEVLVDNSRLLKKYQPINPFAVIKLDLTVKLEEKIPFAELKKKCLQASKLIQKIEMIDQFQDKITLRFYFNHSQRNLTEGEAKGELERIKGLLD